MFWWIISVSLLKFSFKQFIQSLIYVHPLKVVQNELTSLNGGYPHVHFYRKSIIFGYLENLKSKLSRTEYNEFLKLFSRMIEFYSRPSNNSLHSGIVRYNDVIIVNADFAYFCYKHYKHAIIAS